MIASESSPTLPQSGLVTTSASHVVYPVGSRQYPLFALRLLDRLRDSGGVRWFQFHSGASSA